MRGSETQEGGREVTEQARILLVDDDWDFVEATRMLLESRYKVAVAYTADEGLRKARKEKPDLIILDIIMPTADGFMVCEELKKDPQLSKIPVMLLTSLVLPDGRNRRLDDSGHDHGGRGLFGEAGKSRGAVPARREAVEKTVPHGPLIPAPGQALQWAGYCGYLEVSPSSPGPSPGPYYGKPSPCRAKSRGTRRESIHHAILWRERVRETVKTGKKPVRTG